MERTIRLEGRAQRLAQEIAELTEAGNQRVEQLRAQAMELQAGTQRQVEALARDLRAELGLEPDACCHLDTAYMKEHGIIFARTGCERPRSLADIIGQASAGGLH